MNDHTIMLIQPDGSNNDSRQWAAYDSVHDCMEGICKMYEEHLKRVNPNTPTITYDIAQLFDFIDGIYDLSCLVFNKQSAEYTPRNTKWIKERIYFLLRKQAGN